MLMPKIKTGSTALFNSRSTNKMQLLIDNGADTNAKNMYGNTSLFVYEGRKQLQLLIDNGADINAKNFSGQTPLSRAIFNEDARTVQLLISLGADVSYLDPDKGYFSPDKIRELHKMTDRKYMSVTKFLQKNKFDLNTK